MAATPSYRPDPLLALMAEQVSFFFHVTFGIDAIGDFQSVHAVNMQNPSISVPEGGRNWSPHVLFAPPRQRNEIVLRWGMVVRTKLYDWTNAVQLGYGYRRDVYILHLTRSKEVLRVMRLTGCWPTSWTAPELDANQSGFAVEEMTLSYQSMMLVANTALLVSALTTSSSGSSE